MKYIDLRIFEVVALILCAHIRKGDHWYVLRILSFNVFEIYGRKAVDKGVGLIVDSIT